MNDTLYIKYSAFNNIIRYKKSGDDTIYSITINKGVYNMTNISEVFQKYHGSLFAATPTSETLTVDTSKYSQYSEYSDPSITAGTYESSVFTPSNGTFSLTFIGETSTSSTSTNGNKSMIFEIKYNGSEEVTFLWDYDNITRGTARLFGFLPTKQTTVNKMIYSDRTPDVSTHFVDLVIPEIPSANLNAPTLMIAEKAADCILN